MDVKYDTVSSAEAQKRKDQLQLPVLIGMTLILIMLVFMIDGITNPDIAFGVGYIVVVLFSWLFPKNIYSVITAIVCVGLVFVDYYQSQSSITLSKIQFPNLVLSISSISITLILVIASRLRAKDIKKLNHNLEDKVFSRTVELQNKVAEVREKNTVILKTQAELLEAATIARESEYKFKKLFSDAPDAILMVNTKGQIINDNKKTKKVFGYARKELNNAPIKQLLPNFEEVLSFFEGEDKDSKEVICIRKDGIEFPAEISVNPVEVGHKTIYYLAIRDITTRKNNELLRQLQHKKLEEKNNELEQFVYIASHDLQEPVRTVSTFAQMITEDYGNAFDNEGKTMLNHITNSSERMTHLLKGLLEYGRLGTNPEKIEIDCNKLLQQVCDDLDTLVKENGAKVTVEELPTLIGYNTELKVLFQNLIINAIKFKRDDTIPEVTISANRLQDKWEFSVIDNGIGIDKKHLDKVFVIFKRLHKRDAYDGYGIGLAQVKKIVDLHEGEISVSSELKTGTTFTFTISDTIL